MKVLWMHKYSTHLKIKKVNSVIVSPKDLKYKEVSERRRGEGGKERTHNRMETMGRMTKAKKKKNSADKTWSNVLLEQGFSDPLLVFKWFVRTNITELVRMAICLLVI